MDQLHTANKVCGGCCAISLNTVDTESSVSPTDIHVTIVGHSVYRVFLICQFVPILLNNDNNTVL